MSALKLSTQLVTLCISSVLTDWLPLTQGVRMLRDGICLQACQGCSWQYISCLPAIQGEVFTMKMMRWQCSAVVAGMVGVWTWLDIAVRVPKCKDDGWRQSLASNTNTPRCKAT